MSATRIEERPLSTSGKRLCLVVGLAISIPAALNAAAAAWLPDRTPNWSYRMVRAKHQLLERQTSPTDVLFLGDSSCAHGIVPEAWTEATGQTALNLCLVAGLTAWSDAVLLDEYISRVGPPAMLVLLHTVDIWPRTPDPALLGKVPRPLARLWSPPTVDLSLAALWRLGLSRWVPLTGESGSLIARLWGRVEPPEAQFQMDARGWVRGRPHDSRQLADDHENTATFLRTNPHLSLSPENRRALEAIRGLQNTHGFGIVVVRAPMSDAYAQDAALRKARQQERELLQEQLGPHAHFDDGEDFFPDSALEACVDHLSPQAAPTYTRALAARLSSVREP